MCYYGTCMVSKHTLLVFGIEYYYNYVYNLITEK